MTKWHLDTEFNEDGHTIELISLAIVNHDTQQSWYWESSEFNPSNCNDFVRAHVLPKLRGHGVPRQQIADELEQVVLRHYREPEFVAYFADYDWVALCQLYGRMVDLPHGFPHLCLDLQQRLLEHDLKKKWLPPLDPRVEHDALADAHWCRDAWWYLDVALGIRRVFPGYSWQQLAWAAERIHWHLDGTPAEATARLLHLLEEEF